MYNIYRRHSPACRYYQQRGSVAKIKCLCPIWLDGVDEYGRRHRHTLKIRDWQTALVRLGQIENGTPTAQAIAPSTGIPLSTAIEKYLADCRARNLAVNTLDAYTNTLKHLGEYFKGRSLADLTLDALSKYRVARATVASRSSRGEITELRTFLSFCVDREWIAKNPASKLRLPKNDGEPTLPFTDEEVAAMLAACDQIEDTRSPAHASRTRARARALLLTLLYSGMRISDVIKLERSRLEMKTGRLLIRMMKTREPLYVRLPAVAVSALAALNEESPHYFFWNGPEECKFYSAVADASRAIRRVLKRAGVQDGHPHRFRDTFSVTLLRNGVDLHTVQLLLGHTSIKTTEKHYAPFVASMQRLLDDAVATLHFGQPSYRRVRKPRVNAKKNTLRNTQGNAPSRVLAFPRPQIA